MSIHFRIFGLILLACMSLVRVANAETYYLENSKSNPAAKTLIGQVDTSAMDFMLGEDKNMIGTKRAESDFTLQPRIIQLGNGLVVKIEKKNKSGKIISVTQAKAAKVEDLNKAIAKAVGDAVHKVKTHKR
ncbi:MAG: hypothetical protein H7326_11045 [Bdellovibrionaceae bacterium]|nr:hypothetical protein [Pseudobdellovibrionaceae bacterium]